MRPSSPINESISIRSSVDRKLLIFAAAVLVVRAFQSVSQSIHARCALQRNSVARSLTLLQRQSLPPRSSALCPPPPSTFPLALPRPVAIAMAMTGRATRATLQRRNECRPLSRSQNSKFNLTTRRPRKVTRPLSLKTRTVLEPLCTKSTCC